MSNVISEIYAGWKNYAFKNKYVERIAKDRIDICAKCVDPKTGKPGITYKKTCKFCGCFIPAKTRSLSSECPLKKWGRYRV
jgi:hypothetical protein